MNAGVRGLSATILSSAEYFQNQGQGSNQGFVSKLFEDLLDREPSTTELSTYVDLLQTGTPRSSVVTTLLISIEYRNILVKKYYQKYLGRQPSTMELSRGRALLGDRTSEELLQIIIMSSEEYFKRKAPPIEPKKDIIFYAGSFILGTDELSSATSAKINWGDNKKTDLQIKSIDNEAFALFGTHKYRSKGSFKVTVTLKVGDKRYVTRSRVVVGKAKK